MNCPRNTEQTEFSQGLMLNAEELEGTKDFLADFFFRSFITNKAGQVSFFFRRAHTDGGQQNVHEAVRLNAPRDLKPLMNFHSAIFLDRKQINL